MIRVLFVCLGNICRSPTAEAVLRGRAERAGLLAHLHIDSCGTAGWHIGKRPDKRSEHVAAERGYDLSTLRARQFSDEDFRRFDYILTMDRDNLTQVVTRKPHHCDAHIGLFLDFISSSSTVEVPDPYYGGPKGFEQVLDLIESASDALLEKVRAKLS